MRINIKVTRVLFICLTLLNNALLFASVAPQQTPPQIKDFFHTTPDKKLLNTSAAAFTITGSGNIRFLQAFFYSDVACSNVLGGASLIDNSAGFPFSSNAVNLDTSSAYQLANNQGITTGNIACMKLFLDGSNDSSDGVACQSFTDIACSGTTCTSSQNKAVNWAALPTACATRYAYTPNRVGNNVTKCAISTVDGTLSSCVSTGGGFSGPDGVFINNNYAYIANRTVDTVSKCTVSATDGGFSNCATTGSGFSGPFQASINNNYAYVSNFSDDSISKCTVSTTDGTFSSCTTTGSALDKPCQVAINNNYAYIANYGSGAGDVVKCTVSAVDGTLSSCASTGSGFSGPIGIILNNGYAYVGNHTSSSVVKCTVSAVDGSLSSCASTGSGFNGSTGIAFNNGYAYISNFNSSSTSRCTVSATDGTLSSCATTGTGYNSPDLNYVY